MEIQKTKIGDNCNLKRLEDFAPVIMAVAIGSQVLSTVAAGLKENMKKICKDCMNKRIISTADFGGKFRCKICNNLETGVPSIGHGAVCRKCEDKGYCKYCAKQMFEIL